MSTLQKVQQPEQEFSYGKSEFSWFKQVILYCKISHIFLTKN